MGTLAEALAGRASWLLPEARCSAMLLITLLTATLALGRDFTMVNGLFVGLSSVQYATIFALHRLTR